MEDGKEVITDEYRATKAYLVCKIYDLKMKCPKEMQRITTNT